MVMSPHDPSWPIRASHIPGSSDWFKDDHVIQVWPIRILPGIFYWISWGRWQPVFPGLGCGKGPPSWHTPECNTPREYGGWHGRYLRS